MKPLMNTLANLNEIGVFDEIRLWMMVEYRCWKNEKQAIVNVELVEQIS